MPELAMSMRWCGVMSYDSMTVVQVWSDLPRPRAVPGQLGKWARPNGDQSRDMSQIGSYRLALENEDMPVRRNAEGSSVGHGFGKVGRVELSGTLVGHSRGPDDRVKTGAADMDFTES